MNQAQNEEQSSQQGLKKVCNHETKKGFIASAVKIFSGISLTDGDLDYSRWRYVEFKNERSAHDKNSINADRYL